MSDSNSYKSGEEVLRTKPVTDQQRQKDFRDLFGSMDRVTISPGSAELAGDQVRRVSIERMPEPDQGGEIYRGPRPCGLPGTWGYQAGWAIMERGPKPAKGPEMIARMVVGIPAEGVPVRYARALRGTWRRRPWWWVLRLVDRWRDWWVRQPGRVRAARRRLGARRI